MVYGCPPFPGVKTVLDKGKVKADMIVVSQTPLEALKREWDENKIDHYLECIAGQEHGTKTEHLMFATIGKGYGENKVLMVGDAYGDLKAAQGSKALFFPIIPGDEEASWKQFAEEGIEKFFKGTFAGDYQKKLLAALEKALPELLKAAPSQAHALGKSITPKFVVYPPPMVAKPLEFKGAFVTAKGEKAVKVYPLPIPGKNWIKEPVFAGDDGKPLWRLSWMPRAFGGRLEPSVGADKTLWETNAMVWFEGDGCFTGPQGDSLFKRHFENAFFGVSSTEMGVLRFIAPETGRYAVSVKSSLWGSWMSEDKTMSLSLLKFAWKGGPGESLAFQKQLKRVSKGLAMDVETHLVAGEELAFVPDVNAARGYWPCFRITVGLLVKE